MHTCGDYRDLLWDFEYGLLESAECKSVEQHLAACADCRTQLETVRSGRQQFKQAALLDEPIEPFCVDEEAPVALTFPNDTFGAQRPHANRWRLAPLALAAAILVGLGLPFLAYRHGLAEHKAVLDLAQAALLDSESRRDASRQEARAERLALVNSSRTGSLRLQVLGPTRLLRHGHSQFRILTTDLLGHPRKTRVKLTLVDPAQPGQVWFATPETDCSGDWLVTIPAAALEIDRRAARLQVVAFNGTGESRVQEVLPVADPEFLTHLAFSKPSYDLGERVFFRTVTLEEHNLQPAGAVLALTYQLKDPNGQSKGYIDGLTLEGGIGGGEFALEPNWPEGEYTLIVSGRDHGFRAVTRKILVRRPSAISKAVRFDRDVYRPGDPVLVEFQAGRRGGEPAADLPVRLTLEVDEQTIGTRLEGQTDAKGTFKAKFRLPDAIKRGEARLTVGTGLGQAREVFARSVPVVGAEINVEFYPEGGDLIAGVPNRVYVRTLCLSGTPLEVSGRVVDAAGRTVAEVRTVGPAGLGVFTLTPAESDAYQLRIESPTRITSVPNLPRASLGGVVLHVANPVGAAAEPLRIQLHHGGEMRPLLVAAFARGQLVAQQLVIAKPGATAVVLEPTTRHAGVLRVTVFDPLGGVPRPVAERLTFRASAENLDLNVSANGRRYRPGQHLTLDVRSQSERGAAEPAWLLATVVEASAASRTADWASYYSLRSQVHDAADLEYTDLAPGSGPEASRALDLLLATHGWRHFTAGPHASAAAPPRGEMLLLDNQGEIQRRFAGALEELNRGEAALAATVQAEILDRQQDVRTAFASVEDYRERAARSARATLGAVCLVLVTAGGGLLLLGFVRVVQQAPRPRPYFALSFASLLLCSLGVGYLTLADSGVAAPSPEFAQSRPQDEPNEALLPSPMALARREVPFERAGQPRLGESNAAGTAELAVAAHLTGPIDGPRLLIVRPDNEPTALRPLVVRTYAHMNNGAANAPAPDVLLWQPVLFAADGLARIEFDLPTRPATYRVWIHGHSPSGRLGSTQETLISQP